MELRKLIKPEKKGFEDMFFVIVVLFTVVIFILVLSKVWTDIKTPLDEGLSSSMPADSSVNITHVLDKTSETTILFDKLLPFLIIGLFGFVFIVGSIYANHPVMLIIGIILLAVAILLAVIYSNVYHQIAETSQFASTTDNFPISDKFMEYLPFIILILAVGIGAIVLYTKRGGGGAGL